MPITIPIHLRMRVAIALCEHLAFRMSNHPERATDGRQAAVWSLLARFVATDRVSTLLPKKQTARLLMGTGGLGLRGESREARFAAFEQAELEKERRCAAHLDLLDGEEVIQVRHRAGCLILSTHRVRYLERGLGTSKVVSLMLNEIASCSTTYASKPMLLYAGLFAGAMALIAGPGGDANQTWSPLIIVAAILLVIYWRTRHRVLALASAGEVLTVKLTGWSGEDVISFIDDLENAKHAYRSNVGDPRGSAA